jgi:hypothetical protein
VLSFNFSLCMQTESPRGIDALSQPENLGRAEHRRRDDGGMNVSRAREPPVALDDGVGGVDAVNDDRHARLAGNDEGPRVSGLHRNAAAQGAADTKNAPRHPTHRTVPAHAATPARRRSCDELMKVEVNARADLRGNVNRMLPPAAAMRSQNWRLGQSRRARAFFPAEPAAAREAFPSASAPAWAITSSWWLLPEMPTPPTHSPR